MIRFIELFAGIGGFRYGLEAVNRTQDRGGKEAQENGRSQGHEELKGTNATGGQPGEHGYNGRPEKQFACVYANEWDKYAAQIYERNYGEKPDTKDIREVRAEDIPDHDLLTAGFPCQSFSIAGKRGGFEDTRGTLFFEIARIAKQKQPRLLLLENVKGLLSHDQGKTFGTILNTLDELGYDLQWQVLNSKDFGVPQNRERVFIVGHLRGTSRPEVFPLGGTNPKTLEYITGGGLDKWLEDGKNLSRNHSQGQRVYSPEGVSTTMSAEGGGWGAKTGLYAMRWQRTEKGKKARRENQRKGKDYTPFNDGYRECVPVRGKPIGALTSQAIAKDSLIGNETKIRRLTPVECARLQGFPDNWHEGVSDTQAYKAYGNAVTTNVITAIGEKLLLSERGCK
jgi:DNA (cytosine-5)-methyltransferase 1